MIENNNRKLLISVLQMAYSGELAAGLAYRGHWHSVIDPKERLEIQKIEDEEWHHRKLVGEMLADLQAKSIRYREIRAMIIGSVIAMFCHIGGWLAPMFGAGRLESKNIREYETAARHARDCGRVDLINCLLTMAEVEWEHERYFRSKVLNHRWQSGCRFGLSHRKKKVFALLSIKKQPSSRFHRWRQLQLLRAQDYPSIKPPVECGPPSHNFYRTITSTVSSRY
jgi:rubrerythrin